MKLLRRTTPIWVLVLGVIFSGCDTQSDSVSVPVTNNVDSNSTPHENSSQKPVEKNHVRRDGLKNELERSSSKQPIKTQRMRRHTLQHGGIEREYYEFVPRTTVGLSTLPTLVFLHGYGGTATGVQAETTNGLNRYAQRYGYRVIYPQGTWFISGESDSANVITSWNDLAGNHATGPEGPLCSADAAQYPCPPECGTCERCHWTACHDDVGFLRELIAMLSARNDLDGTQLFISGFSNGSMMAQRMACLLPNDFKAVALVGGRLASGFGCVPNAAVPMLQINGGNDEVVPVGGRTPTSEYFYQSAEEVTTTWAKANGCSVPPRNGGLSGIDTTKLSCESRCAGERREVTDCLWVEGGHRWPGYPEGHGSNGYCVGDEQKNSIKMRQLCEEPNTTVDVWGSRVVFDFFERHRKAREQGGP